MGLFSKVKDLALGKKDTGEKGGYIDLDKTLADTTTQGRMRQQQALGIYDKELQKLSGEGVESELAAEQARRTKIAQQKGADQRMRMSDVLAQRGMGRSASGLRMLSEADNRGLEGVANVRAGRTMLRKQMEDSRLSKLGMISGGVNSILNARGAERGYEQAVKGKGRSGGLLKVGLMGAGAAAGFLAGGPQGIGPGMQMGSGMGQSVANL